MIRTPRQILRWWYQRDGACGTHGGEAKYIHIGFYGENSSEETIWKA